MAKSNIFKFLTFALFGFLFWHAGMEMLITKTDGLYVGQINLYGDLVFHLGFINKFLETNSLFVTSPIYAGTKPNYPIFADFITAQISKLTGVDYALFLTTFLGGLLTIYVARLFIKNFIKSEAVIFLSLLLFFASGGFGFYYFFEDYVTSGQNFQGFLLNLPREYTDLKDLGFWWINSILAYFLPQRGFLFAFPITLTVIGLWYQGAKKQKKSYFILAGVLAGILPIIQTHSLLVLFILAAFYTPLSLVVYKRVRKETVTNWLLFALVTTLIALPTFKGVSEDQNFLKFLRLDPGWTSKENIFWFWLKNLGLFLPLLVASLFWLYRKSLKLFGLYLPFLFIFIISNLFVFQPWEFDNSKLLIYWYFASSVIVAFFIYDFFLTENIAKKIVGIVLILFTIFSGTIDLFRTFTPPTIYKIFTSRDLTIAEAVKRQTPKEALFVTASTHNHPVTALAGRTTLVGYHGWLWSHGINYNERADEVNAIYKGDSQAEAYLKKYKVFYIVVGSLEEQEFNVNYDFLERYPKITLPENWILYDVSNLWSDGNR